MFLLFVCLPRRSNRPEHDVRGRRVDLRRDPAGVHRAARTLQALVAGQLSAHHLVRLPGGGEARPGGECRLVLRAGDVSLRLHLLHLHHQGEVVQGEQDTQEERH